MAGTAGHCHRNARQRIARLRFARLRSAPQAQRLQAVGFQPGGLVASGAMGFRVVYKFPAVTLFLYITAHVHPMAEPEATSPQIWRIWQATATGAELRYNRKGKTEQDVHWSAIIVESVRVDGEPKQRHSPTWAASRKARSISISAINVRGFGTT
jgi:hypothetical protein